MYEDFSICVVWNKLIYSLSYYFHFVALELISTDTTCFLAIL
ncbi:MAG: hypothetical protein [Malazfec virus 1]